MHTNTGRFRNLFSGLQQYSPENEIPVASVEKKKNGTNYMHSQGNRTNLPCDVYEGLKCGPFEQDFTVVGFFRFEIWDRGRERVIKK